MSRTAAPVAERTRRAAPRRGRAPAGAPARGSRARNPFGALSIVVSLAALVLGLVPLVGFVSWPLAIAGAVLGIVGTTRSLGRHLPSIAGIVLGAVALVVGLVISVSGLGSVAASMAAASAQPQAVVPVVPVARPTATPGAVRVTDVSAPGTPSEGWILADPGGTRYGGYPPLQRRVVATIAAADVAYRRATGDAARARIVAARDAAVCRLVPGGVFTGWVGSVHATGTTATGSGSIEVHIATTMVLQTWDNALSDTGLHTLVPKSSPVYRTLTTVTPGTLVRFSGVLLPSAGSCLQQENLTQDMYGLDPNFIVRVTALAPR